MISTLRLFVLTGLILLATSTFALAQAETTVRRAAFDIGSAAIKCTVADVDLISGSIEKVVEEFSRKVDFAEDMARSYDGNFSKAILQKGTTALKELKTLAQKRGATDFSAVGGAAFRTARNGRAYFATLEQQLGIKTRITSKQQASLIAYHAVTQTKEAASSNVLVWDIGGGSMEMTTRNKDRSLTFYIEPMASVPFKNTIIQVIQKKDINTTNTPNPISLAEANHAVSYAQTYAETHVSQQLVARFASGNMKIIGIGGVHFYSIPALTGTEQKPYTREDLQAAVEKWADLPDEAFDSEYANTRFSNLLLVLGYMQALDIETVTPLKINQADGLLVAPEFW